MSERARLAWFAAVVFVAVYGIGELVRWIVDSTEGPSWWAIDFQLVVDAANRLLEDPRSTPTPSSCIRRWRRLWPYR